MAVITSLLSQKSREYNKDLVKQKRNLLQKIINQIGTIMILALLVSLHKLLVILPVMFGLAYLIGGQVVIAKKKDLK
ncbi:hypothetical protein [Wolbachia endosymbiont (group E) of Neria commutata]|uniref:hypothetical protein n=1 Tax=Wolbachia endosymbiont (group E) of Neria commutata TaxID=3066149 RepID=UPI0031332DB0